MDSASQLDALLEHRLDVAILRISPRMLLDHPGGWEHRLLRLEPLVLVGRPTGVQRATASLHESPLEVFGDPPESGSYKRARRLPHRPGARSRRDAAMARHAGAFSHYLARVTRSAGRAHFLEFHSYAVRFAAHGLPLHWPQEVQPFYPWSLAWRAEPASPALADFLRLARALSAGRGWLGHPPAAPGSPWLPPDDPSRAGPPEAQR